MIKTLSRIDTEFLLLNLANRKLELDGEEMDAILIDFYPEIDTSEEVRYSTDTMQMA